MELLMITQRRSRTQDQVRLISESEQLSIFRKVK